MHCTSREWGYWGANPVDPSASLINDIKSVLGCNVIRIGMKWETLQPSLGGTLNSSELNSVITNIKNIVNAGMSCIVDLHAWGGRQSSSNVTWAADTHLGKEIDGKYLSDFWGKLHKELKNIPNLQYDLMNEPMILDNNKVSSSFKGIIHYEDVSFDLGSVANNLQPFFSLNDPLNKTVLHFHCYNAWSEVGSWALPQVNNALKSRGKKYFLGEFGFSDAENTRSYISYMANNKDVCLGFTYFCGPNTNFSRTDSSVGDIEPYPGFPSHYCQWIISDDGTQLKWDRGEKFHYYVEWLQYLIVNFFQPWGIVVNGKIKWQGARKFDKGWLISDSNQVCTERRTGKGSTKWSYPYSEFSFAEVNKVVKKGSDTTNKV
ncbi:glycoside hydrolase family 5 protein [Gonapodya prolifera JEL478]|uniref:cellulase n=1 Tax=Gonapodya prolifera (strain JEL478) TaxID=1344416 RepID=A0A138ZWJ1_GONPJ|nr:glycoside hydrolase family 5 protein [Gonapodya prolifera JEL478]|eukprot:KXS08890.1 glycoside hydrolase family 5 protein [Gonapodya prolifera JEL478]